MSALTDFLQFINQTNRDLGMLQEAQRMAGDGDLLDENTGDTPIGELDPSLAEESVWDMLTSIMAGTQGTIEGLDPETIDALETAIEGSSAEELETIAQEIAEAGGYEEWLAQQPPEQVGINLEDFEEQFPDLDREEYFEDGTWTDLETGTVYVINIPPEIEDPEVGGGGGGGDAEAAKDAESDKDAEAAKDAQAESKKDTRAERAKDEQAERDKKELANAEAEAAKPMPILAKKINS